MVESGTLVLHVKGADRLWAFKGSLEIPLQHIVAIQARQTSFQNPVLGREVLILQ
jgi:hypothetical protein